LAEENKEGQTKTRMPTIMQMEQVWNDKFTVGAEALISELDIGE
jgi:hypothetical protein